MEPRSVARLLAAVESAFRAGERECNTGRSADRERRTVERYALNLGLRTEWPGLLPSFTLDGKGVRLPVV